jgi:hypothetical protein
LAQPYVSPQHTLVHEVERILTVDLTAAEAQAKEAAPATGHEGGRQCIAFARANQNIAAAATLLDMLPAPSADMVDKLYC